MATRLEKVVVVGDGIIGCTLAYELARAGFATEVVGDSQQDSASYGNAGILAISYAMPMANPSSLLSGIRSGLGLSHDVQFGRPLSAASLAWFSRFALASRPFRAQKSAVRIHQQARQSLALYDLFAEREEVDLGLNRSGWLYLAGTHEALRQQQKSAAALESLGITHSVLDASELYSLEPSVGPGRVGAVLYHDDVSMDPGHLTAQFRAAARRRGVTFRQGRVISAEKGTDGTVESVTTEDGETLAGDFFAVATGAESRETARFFGSRLAVEPGYGWNAMFNAPRRLATRPLMGIENHVIVNAGRDSVRVTGGMQFGGSRNKRPSSEQVAALRESAEAILPELVELGEPVSTWRGARPMSPDGEMLIKWLTSNALAVSGHGTLGMTLAPASAEQACAAISAQCRGHSRVTTGA